MNAYLVLKTVHILSSVLLVGTGFGTAFYLFFVNRCDSLEARVVVSRLVVRADTWFTTPAAIVQPLSGAALAHIAGWPLSTPWLALSLGLSVVAEGVETPEQLDLLAKEGCQYYQGFLCSEPLTGAALAELVGR